MFIGSSESFNAPISLLENRTILKRCLYSRDISDQASSSDKYLRFEMRPATSTCQAKRPYVEVQFDSVALR